MEAGLVWTHMDTGLDNRETGLDNGETIFNYMWIGQGLFLLRVGFFLAFLSLVAYLG